MTALRKTYRVCVMLSFLTAACLFCSPQVRAERAALAISPFSGPKAAKPKNFEEAIVRALQNQSLDLLSPSQIRKIAKKNKASIRGNYAAELSGADYRIFGKLSGKRGRYQLRVQLIELFSDKTIERAKWNYKLSRKSSMDSVSENAEKAATAICDKFVKKISNHFPTMVGRRPVLAGELPQPKSGS